ncbi:hypothetical protein EJP77_06520 [Paenibacillus zeisoli]|uniref:Uncharacterized protein n=1 Tax=Paenibacillus zeisoli TaxID=2496267 RepID=A0A3S1BA21_9BACL|nr:hypothetical protein EJP77_06520 [Paenibacillus zeisoli]
MSNCPRGQEGS